MTAVEPPAGEHPVSGHPVSEHPASRPPAGEHAVRVMRVIARLNMGGPALHVSYLAAGLEERGYATTLVSGTLARGESSMAFVADRLGVRVVPLPELGREISPLRDVVAAWKLARLVREERPHILHTHTAKAGAVGRAAVKPDRASHRQGSRLSL